MVVEVTTFRLAPGADEEAFLAADEDVQTSFSVFQPGMVRRTTARGDAGGWLVLTLWGTTADAGAAEEASATDPACAAFHALVDAGSVEVRRFETRS
jgi:hypothetical protein